MTEVYPIGTVVKLKETEKFSLMIAGYFPETKEGIFDYYCVPYPFGLKDIDESLCINEALIDSVKFTGYRNEEFGSFQKEFKLISERLNQKNPGSNT